MTRPNERSGLRLFFPSSLGPRPCRIGNRGRATLVKVKAGHVLDTRVTAGADCTPYIHALYMISRRRTATPYKCKNDIDSWAFRAMDHEDLGLAPVAPKISLVMEETSTFLSDNDFTRDEQVSEQVSRSELSHPDQDFVSARPSKKCSISVIDRFNTADQKDICPISTPYGYGGQATLIEEALHWGSRDFVEASYVLS